MRITNNSQINPFLLNLNGIETRKANAEYKLSTGKDIQYTSDDPGRLVNIKQLTETINKNDFYINNIESSLSEIRFVGEQIDAMSEKFARLRSLAVDATATGNSGNVFTLGVYVKGIIEDIVRDANTDYNGKYIFSGTKTTEESIVPTPPALNKNPFEIVYEAVTTDNPSGMKIVFKGNNEDRVINKDAVSTEIINTKPFELFGEGGTEMFEPLIELYNIMTYETDGTTRDVNSAINRADSARLNAAQEKIAQFNDRINNISSRNGSKIIRLEALLSQTENEQIRLKDYRSLNADADVAKATMDLAKENSILDYSLKIGGNIIGRTLFDFLG